VSPQLTTLWLQVVVVQDVIFLVAAALEVFVQEPDLQ
jgi:hypothetical protein